MKKISLNEKGADWFLSNYPHPFGVYKKYVLTHSCPNSNW